MIRSQLASESHKSAEQLLKKANQAVRSIWFIKSADHEKASTYYQSAGIQFKLSKEYEHAANAYLLAANSFEKLGSSYDQINSLLEAARCYTLANQMTNSEQCYRQLITLSINQNRFNQAGDVCGELGKTYEKIGEHQRALDKYELAENYYEVQNNENMISRIWELKANLLSREKIDLKMASDLYVKLARKGSAIYRGRPYYWKAGVCVLLNTLINDRGEVLSEAVLRIDQYDLRENTKEYQSLESLSEIVGENDLCQFNCWAKNQDQNDKWNLDIFQLFRNEIGKIPNLV